MILSHSHFSMLYRALSAPQQEDPPQAQLHMIRRDDTLKRRNTAEYADVPILAFGPFEAPVYRVDNVCRMRMVVKCRLNKRSRALFADLLTSFGKSPAGVQLSIDFNPSTL